MKPLVLAALLLGSLLLARPSAGQGNPVLNVMEQAIGTAPQVMASKADIERANATAARLRAGPYEYEVSASGGQRMIDDPLASEARYTEWAAGVSRTVRLPGKQRIDRDLARLEIELANAAFDQTLYEERLTFADLWRDWVLAALLTETSDAQAAEADHLAELEQLRVDKGAGRQIRADQLAAEASLVRFQAEQDKLTAAAARIALMARYPEIVLPPHPPMLDLSRAEIALMLESSADSSPSYRAAQLVGERARTRARRARSDQMPDPTLGMEFTNDFGGGETSLVARVTIPIGGVARREEAREMAGSATVAELNAVSVYRQWLQDLEVTRQSARLSMALHEESLRAIDTSSLVLKKIQKGYDLGEVTITDLISSRRQQLSAQRVAAEQQAAMETAFLKLIILGGEEKIYEN